VVWVILEEEAQVEEAVVPLVVVVPQDLEVLIQAEAEVELEIPLYHQQFQVAQVAQELSSLDTQIQTQLQ
jgi:hypothetical protein